MYIPLEIGSVRDQSLAEARRVIEAGACAGAMAMAATMAPTQAHPFHSTLLQTPLLAPAGEQRGLEFGHRRSGVTRGGHSPQSTVSAVGSGKSRGAAKGHAAPTSCALG